MKRHMVIFTLLLALSGCTGIDMASLSLAPSKIYAYPDVNPASISAEPISDTERSSNRLPLNVPPEKAVTEATASRADDATYDAESDTRVTSIPADSKSNSRIFDLPKSKDGTMILPASPRLKIIDVTDIHYALSQASDSAEDLELAPPGSASSAKTVAVVTAN